MHPRGRNGWMIGRLSGDEYDRAFEDRAARGQDMHGEADFVERLGPHSALDAGCGTGRVAIELARRGVDVVGIDIDPAMLVTARAKAPQIDWRQGDLACVSLNRMFDVVLLAGNVMVFLPPGSEGRVIDTMARHLASGGLLVAGFQLGISVSLDRYDALTTGAGLQLAGRWATWDMEPWQRGSDYAISVHQKTMA